MGPVLKKSGAVVLGVSKDSIESHNKFAKKYKLPFVLLSDPKTEVMKKYGAFGKKMMYGKPVQGTIRSTVVIGPNGAVIKHWPTIKKAEAHPDEVLAFLKR
jgi:peroxiredoxin Q/BCP